MPRQTDASPLGTSSRKCRRAASKELLHRFAAVGVTFWQDADVEDVRRDGLCCQLELGGSRVSEGQVKDAELSVEPAADVPLGVA